MITKQYTDGQPPVGIDVFTQEEEVPGEGHMAVFGTATHVEVPKELGSGMAHITHRSTVDTCPLCQRVNKTHLIVTDRIGPNGGSLAVICCTTKGQYGWLELPE